MLLLTRASDRDRREINGRVEKGKDTPKLYFVCTTGVFFAGSRETVRVHPLLLFRDRRMNS